MSRRCLGAGTLLALALGLGGPAAAMADEVLGRPTVTATAESTIGPTLTAQPPESSDPQEDQLPAPINTTSDLGPGAPPTEPGPTSTDSVPGTSETGTGHPTTESAEDALAQPAHTQPAPTGTATLGGDRGIQTQPVASTGTPAAAADADPSLSAEDVTAVTPQAADRPETPRASISEFDCNALAATVTIDNTGSGGGAQIRIWVSHWSPANPEQGGAAASQMVSVAAGATKTVSVRLADDAKNTVGVSWEEGFDTTTELATRSASCGAYNFDPRATQGDASCERAVVPAVLDNSRSGHPATYNVQVFSWTPLGQDSTSSFDGSFVVAAGDTQAVSLPLVDNARNLFVIAVDGPFVEPLISGEITCGRYFNASVEGIDCETLTARVTLDNRQSPEPTTFLVRTTTDPTAPAAYSAQIVVPGGEVEVTTARLKLNSTYQNTVAVTGPTQHWLASEELFCGGDQPDVGSDEADCQNMTLRIKIYNNFPRSIDAFRFTWPDDSAAGHGEVTVAAGEVRVLEVPIPDSGEVSLEGESGGWGFSTGCRSTHKTVAPASHNPDEAGIPVPSAAADALPATGATITEPLLCGLALVAGGLALGFTARKRERQH